MREEPIFWVLFITFVAVMLVLDLAVFHRGARTVRVRSAMAWSAFWIALAGAFAVLVYFWHGKTPALEFVTGYLIEESLSVDNLFVFLLLFRYFKVPDQYQHKVLFWGIIGALVMRLAFIVLGVALIHRFEWITYIFGAFLVYTGIKLVRSEEIAVEPERNPVLRWVRKFLPVTPDYVDGKFFVRDAGLYATPLFLVLIVIETTDVIFAVDSIPAVLAITRDAFIVFTSNVFAILGLRSLYFALAGMLELFHFLHYGLAAILSFIGIKMLISHYYTIPTSIALGVVGVVLAISVAASAAFPKKIENP
ncbi:MAG TPA: TerC family protein [Terriglobales bacterium]|nr:TerC family protein [Terriglobales bacterium]